MFYYPYKYDVAISVAEEDRFVAEQIVEELDKRKIRCYYYKKEAAKSWGEYLVRLSADAYGIHSRFVLVITSKIYVEKYWSGIERQIALSELVKTQRILQLRLDHTPVDGISKHRVAVDWHNNPAVIAALLEQKLAPYRRAKRGRQLTAFCAAALLAGVLAWNFWQSPVLGAFSGHVPPLNKVAIATPVDSFYISSTEVTVAQFKAFCENQHRPFPPQPIPSREGGPVRNVTWEEADAFCKWSEGRLPTEKEWEYAAAGGAATTYSGGNNASKVAIYNRKKPDNVARRSPNQYGLYDMTGNVAEWCDDWYDSAQTGKVVRGGAYNSTINPINELDMSLRRKERPESRSPAIGFRVAWSKKILSP